LVILFAEKGKENWGGLWIKKHLNYAGGDITQVRRGTQEE